MGEIAARLADACVVTSDNPRSEEPEAIIAEILPAGDLEDGPADAERRASRSSRTGGPRSRSRSGRRDPGDTVVIAGKGHEQGQELAGGRKIPFDDREVAKEELRRLRSGSGV